MSIYGEPSNGAKTVTTTQNHQPHQSDIQLLNDFVNRNTSILTQLLEQMNKSKAEQRLLLLKEEIEMKTANFTRSVAK